MPKKNTQNSIGKAQTAMSNRQFQIMQERCSVSGGKTHARKQRKPRRKNK